MAMEILNQSSYEAWSTAGDNRAESAGKKETRKTSEKGGQSSAKSTAEYLNELKKLVPSVEFGIGSALSSAKKGKTLTINPKLLEKMQNDPAQEKETKELIKGVESAMNMIDSVNKASGWTVVYKHSYIDENGKYHSIGYYRNDFMLNLSDKLREERRKNSEKLLERQKETAAEKKEDLQENPEEKSGYSRMKEILDKKIAASRDGRMYLNEEDYRKLTQTAREDSGVKISISQEGMKYYREQIQGRKEMITDEFRRFSSKHQSRK